MGPDSLGQVIKDKVAKSCINLLLKNLPAASELLILPLDLLDNVLKYLNAQAELLLVFASYLSRCDSSQPSKHQCVPIFVDVIKASGSVIRVLDDVKPCTPELKETIKLLLSLLLTSFDYCLKSDIQTKSELVGANVLSDISFASLGILPTLCYLTEAVEYCNIAISTMDVILKDFLISSTWLPVLQKHLNLQNAISKLQDKNPLISVIVVLKFFLTLARTHGGAELLQSVNILSSLKYLFSQLLVEKPSTALRQLEGGLVSTTGNDGKAESIWGLGLAIVIAMIDSLADCPSSADIAESMILFFFVEKSDLISYYLSAPDLPADDQCKKRARTKNASISLHTLVETQSTLELICTLAKHQIVWNKTMKGRDSALREQIIHLLAFISKGGQQIGEDPSKTPSIMWLSVSKDQLVSYGRLQLMGSKHGWLALSALNGNHTSLSPGAGTALVEANQIKEPIQASSKIHFSDSVALLMYKIAYFLLTFLCSQAEAAAKRAEDVGFIDLAHYPELPMPEILHGLQVFVP